MIDEKKFLERFAKTLGVNNVLEDMIMKEQREKNLLEGLNNTLQKLSGAEIKQVEEAFVEPMPLIEEPVVELIEEPILEQPKIIVEMGRQPEPELPKDDIVTKSVMALSKANQQTGNIQTIADSLPDGIRKEIDIIKKSIADFHRFAQNHSQMGGGGEVNLRNLDDVNRSTIVGGNFLKYNASSKKFEFANVTSDGVDWRHVPSDIIPNANIVYSLGNTSNYWNNLYTNSINVPVGSVITSTLTISPIISNEILSTILNYSTNSSSIPIGTYGNANEIPAPWAVYRLTRTPNPILQVDDLIAGTGVPLNSYLNYIGSGAYANVIIANTTFTLAPPENGTELTFTRDVTNPSLSITTTSNTNIALTPGNNGIIAIDGDIIPVNTNENRLGTPAKRFKELWLGPGTLYVADETLGVDQSLGAKDGNFYIKGGAGFQVGEFRFRDNQIAIANNSREILFGTTLATGNVVFNRPIAVKSYDTGNTTFSVSRSGRVSIFAPSIPANDIGAFSIIGSANGDYQPVTNPGGMVHITGNDGNSTRFDIDNFSTGNTSSFPAIIGRAARGTAETPSALQANDIQLRISTAGWKTESGFGGATVSSQTLDLVALETFYDNSRGTAFKFYNAPLGGSARTLSLTVDSTGLTTNNVTLTTLTANGSIGTSGQVLTSNSTGAYWEDPSYYGSFYYSGANVALSSATTAYVVPIANTYSANGIILGGNNSIQFSHTGTYQFTFSIQYQSTDNDSNNIDVWIRKNTLDVDDSSSMFTITKKADANHPGALIAVTPFIFEIAAGDKIQVMTAVHTGTAVSITTIPAQVSPTTPRTPAVIYTVTQIR